ncbi:hypothetical protein V3C99_018888 [Haemonchus contortus]
MRVFFFCLFLTLSSAAPEWERINTLPNLVEPLRSKHYAGYVQISQVKQLFYWYIESENDPVNDPVVLFLNGGPGCSSLQGLFLEMGPLRVNNYGETVTRNPWTWNRYANIIYLDAPAGVGFSVRLDGLWNYTDNEVASDNYAAVKEWFKKFPERSKNDFYAAGESYAGTYIPMLSALLVEDKNINFKGMLIGNGCVDDVLNFNSLVDFNYNHGFIDERYYRQSVMKCCNNVPDHCDFYKMSLNETGFCYDEATYLNTANFYTGLDPYFIYYSCYLDAGDAPVPTGLATVTLRSHMRRKSIRDQLQPACAHHNDSVVYLQRPDVRAALRIMDVVPQYETCNMDISDNYDFGASHVISQTENFKKVIKAGKSVALFYGDTDTLCNAVHGAQFAANLGLPEIAPLRPYLDNEQLPPTIGFLTQYKGLDMLTVRGAGHFVASTNEKPKEALQVFVNFIDKTSYDTPVSHDLPYVPPSPADTPTTTSEDIPVNWDSAPWLITDLPNLDEPLSSKQYSGYLSVSETRKLFYWYIESENDPNKDPVVLWLNGGPGCSSLEGLFMEMGPFRARNYGAYITRNKWTWNRVASIIYLDAPAGVGFSIDLNGTDHVFTDDEVAHDNLIAVTEWFKKFPERRKNDFYVAGESYGGTYVPMLSALLLEDFPQFKGMLIGNGCMDDRLLYNSLVGYNYDHTFIDESRYRSAVDNCCPNNSSYGCDFYEMSLDSANDCYNDSLALNQANVLTGLDPFFLYYTCRLDDASSSSDQRSTVLNTHFRKYGYMEVAASCDHYNDSTVYLQREDVRRALNIPSIVPAYESCNEDIENNYDMIETHYITQHDNVKNVIDANKKVALFYGDVDSICNAIHGAQFASELGLKLEAPQSIYTDQQQEPPTIGFITQYEGLDFLTVRGAGHFVASSDEKPKEALQLFVNFLRGTNYSTPIDYVFPTPSPSTPPLCTTPHPSSSESWTTSTPSTSTTSTSSTNSSNGSTMKYLLFPLVLVFVALLRQ